MLKTFEETVTMIHNNKLLHICAPQNLLTKLPTGNWVGGSSSYYATESENADDFRKLCVFELEFDTEGFFAKEFIINGKKENIVDYAAAYNINLQLPFVGEYSGSEINSCILQISNDKVITLATPVFKGIKYRFAKPLDNYADAFIGKINGIPNKDCVFLATAFAICSTATCRIMIWADFIARMFMVKSPIS